MLQHGGIALTESIDIHNGTEIIQSVMARDFSCFPYRSFNGLPIAHQDIRSVIQLVDKFCIQSNAYTNRQSLPE